MATFGGTYSTGTISVDADDTTVTGSGTLWASIAEQGDWLYADGNIGIIQTVTDDTHLELELGWAGATLSGENYRLIKMSWLRYEPALTQKKVRELLEKLATVGIIYYVTGSEPDPLIGDDGNLAVKTNATPWLWWVWDGGVWVETASPFPVNVQGTYGAGTTYAVGDLVTYNGSIWRSLQDANTGNQPDISPSWWELFISKGDTGATGATGPTGPAGSATSSTTFLLTGIISPSQITSNQNNYAPTGHASCAVLRLSSDASRNVTGLAGGAGGRIVIVHNVGAQSIVLKDESASSSAANRFALTADLTLAADAVALLQYDGTSSRWRAVSGGGGGGVTSVTAGVGLSGGTITSTGTINVQVPLFQCQFNKSGSDLALTRWNGKYLFINGVNEVIPSGGVTLAPTGLTANTTYYVYAYINAGTMTLEASTTAPTVDTTYGHKTKTGDATRSLVGMARAVAGPAWEDSALRRFVLSYYNRRNIVGTVTSIDTSSTTSSSYVAINSTNKLEFLTWGDEAVIQNASGILNNSTTAGMSFTVGLDGTANTSARTQLNGGNASMQTPMSTTAVNSVAEGYHYAQTWAASVTAGNTTTIFTNWSNILVRG